MKTINAILLALTLGTSFTTSSFAEQETARPGVLKKDGLRTPVPKLGDIDVTRADVKNGFTFFASGDLIGPHHPLRGLEDPDYTKVTKIIQSADVAFANFEASAFNLSSFTGTRAAQNGGGYPLFDHAVTREFKEMGLDIVSMANNHAGDWGTEGIVATLDTLAEVGLIQAGAGGSLTQAREPGLFQTPKGRVALISTASTYNPATPAADGVGALKPRPGISVLRTTVSNVVTEKELTALEPLAALRGGASEDSTKVRLGGNTFIRPNIPGVTYTDASQLDGGVSNFIAGDQVHIDYVVNQDDETAVLDSITNAKKINDFVAFTIHAHETAGLEDSAVPATFLPTLFHKAIDAGAAGHWD